MSPVLQDKCNIEIFLSPGVAVLHRFYCIAITLFRERMTRALIRLRRCAGRAAPLLFACSKVRFTRVEDRMFDSTTTSEHRKLLSGGRCCNLVCMQQS